MRYIESKKITEAIEDFYSAHENDTNWCSQLFEKLGQDRPIVCSCEIAEEQYDHYTYGDWLEEGIRFAVNHELCNDHVIYFINEIPMIDTEVWYWIVAEGYHNDLEDCIVSKIRDLI